MVFSASPNDGPCRPAWLHLVWLKLALECEGFEKLYPLLPIFVW